MTAGLASLEEPYRAGACAARRRRPRDDPEIAALTIDDLRESRLFVVDPAPIPADELQRTFDWMKSWGFLDHVCDAQQLIRADIQQSGHADAARGRIAAL